MQEFYFCIFKRQMAPNITKYGQLLYFLHYIMYHFKMEWISIVNINWVPDEFKGFFIIIIWAQTYWFDCQKVDNYIVRESLYISTFALCF